MAQESSQIRRTARGDAERKTADATQPPLPGGELDRRTAVTNVHRKQRPSEGGEPEPIDESVPVLKSSIGADGLTKLELDETTIAGAEWLRPGEPPAMPATTSGAGASLTAVGRPPPPSPSRRPWLVAAALAPIAVIAAVLAWPRAERAPAIPAPIATIDAAPAPPEVATLVVESVPPGAHGTVGDQVIVATPVTLQVPLGHLALHLELDGHDPYDENVEVNAGKVLLRALMVPAGARLIVTTEPPGAKVTLDGQDVGTTPLTLDDVPVHVARVGLSKPGFIATAATVELAAGRDARVARTLKSAPTPTGTIALQIANGWGEVFLNGKKVGQAPARALRLPLGRHHLKIVNPPTGRVVELNVEVTADENRYYKATFP
jgi:hypothetical protein